MDAVVIGLIVSSHGTSAQEFLLLKNAADNNAAVTEDTRVRVFNLASAVKVYLRSKFCRSLPQVKWRKSGSFLSSIVNTGRRFFPADTPCFLRPPL